MRERVTPLLNVIGEVAELIKNFHSTPDLDPDGRDNGTSQQNDLHTNTKDSLRRILVSGSSADSGTTLQDNAQAGFATADQECTGSPDWEARLKIYLKLCARKAWSLSGFPLGWLLPFNSCGFNNLKQYKKILLQMLEFVIQDMIGDGNYEQKKRRLPEGRVGGNETGIHRQPQHTDNQSAISRKLRYILTNHLTITDGNKCNDIIEVFKQFQPNLEKFLAEKRPSETAFAVNTPAAEVWWSHIQRPHKGLL